MTANELFQAGRLDEAVTAVVQEVKDQPGDLSRRTLLFSLLCFQGDLERARKQLSAIDSLTTQTDAAAYLNLLAAEESRRQVFHDGALPKFFVDPPQRIEKSLAAVRRIKEHNFAEAHRLLDEAEAARPEFAGTFNGASFDDFADADDVTRSVVEFFQGRDYYWLPVDQLLQLQVVVPDPIRPRDLFWAPCQVFFKDGKAQRGFTSVLYIDSFQAHDDSLRLGHSTSFHDTGHGVFRGTGRKQFVAGDADPTPLELNDVTFA